MENKNTTEMEKLTVENIELLNEINGSVTEKMVSIIDSINNQEKVITEDMVKIIDSINGK
jgi:hypothetical protein